MITQVSGLNGNGVVAKDPRRKSQSIRFKHRPMTACKQNCTFHQAEHTAQREAILRSAVVCGGAAAFVGGCCLWKGMKQMGKWI